ncbi:MAG TPA: YciI family protein [Candidatus Dormibacteraeota bacterium]|jgi:hypothetical protein|nr:YciI family protein [Candidatus Dormibacteraeota bacterium]
MKYVLLLCDTEETTGRSEAEVAPYYGQIATWWKEQMDAGRLIGGEQLQAPATATTVRHTKNGPLITDGPFIEAKETVGGYAVVDVPDLDAAMDMAKSWPWGGTVEIRPIIEMNGSMGQQ